MDTRLLCPWDFLGKSTGVGCHFLLQGILQTQESNPGLPHCRQMVYRLSHKEVLSHMREKKKNQNTKPSGSMKKAQRKGVDTGFEYTNTVIFYNNCKQRF